MRNFVKDFWQDTSGAITVDWIFLTSLVIGFVLAMMSVLSPGLISAGGALTASAGISLSF